MKTYQYKWVPVTQTNLNNYVGTGLTVIPISEFLVNIQSDESLKPDLDAYMTQLGFQYVGEII